jgi:hypothetical protein
MKAPSSKSDKELSRELNRLEKRLWLDEGKAIVNPFLIADNHVKQAIIVECERKFGKR